MEIKKDKVKKRVVSSSSSSSPSSSSPNKEKVIEKEQHNEKTVVNDDEVQQSSSSSSTKSTKPIDKRRDITKTKNASCIRLIGIILITLVTFIMWNHFYQVDDTDHSLFIKDMPNPLLAHYQSGSFIPVFNKHTRKQFKLFVTAYNADQQQQELEFLPFEDDKSKEKNKGRKRLPPTESVVLVHGKTSSSFAMRSILQELYRQNLRGIAIDLPCHGFSDGLANCSYSYLADRLADVLDALQLQSTHLYFYDTSAVIGTMFFERFPSRVKSLVYADPALDLNPTFQPFYIRLASLPILNRQIISFVTNPYLSYIRTLYFNKILGAKDLSRDVVDSYAYLLRYRNNIDNYIKGILQTEFSVHASYNLKVSRISYDRSIPKLVVINSKQLKGHNADYVQVNYKFENINLAEINYMVCEELGVSMALHIVSMVDDVDRTLRDVKYIDIEPVQGGHSHGGVAQGHGHSHGAAQGHGHSHGGGNDHGHSHGGGNSHGHSHGGNSKSHGHSHGGNDHGHSHGGGNSHGHSHGGNDHGHSH